MCKIRALRERRARLAKRILEKPSCPPFETEEPWRHHHGQRFAGGFHEPIEFLKFESEASQEFINMMKSIDLIKKSLTFDGRLQTTPSGLTEELWSIAADQKLTLIVISGETIRTYHPPYPYSDEDVKFFQDCPGAVVGASFPDWMIKYISKSGDKS